VEDRVRKLALVSCSDKTGVVEFAAGLLRLGYSIVSTGGTAQVLFDAGVPVEPIETVTRMPAMLDGRVKTLHPAVHAGILARRSDPAHMETIAHLGIETVDVVAVNLYPFREMVANPAATYDDCVEQIDVGGPTMLRAAAKNHADVVVVTDPGDYADVIEDLEAGAMGVERRKQLAAKAFALLSDYDGAVARWLVTSEAGAPAVATTAAELNVHLSDAQPLRYGENPHQQAWRYTDTTHALVRPPPFQVHQGKELSYNNLVDADAAWQLVCDLPPDRHAACFVKHTNPCGVGVVPTSAAGAVLRALDTDPTSAFGGVVALNRPVDVTAVRAIGDRFIEVLLAPAFDDDALEELAKKPNLRVVTMGPVGPPPVRVMLRPTVFGVLAQQPDVGGLDFGTTPQIVTTTQPTAVELDALNILWRICKHVKSNAIVVGDQHGTVGIGAGQMSRVDSAVIACGKARKGLKATAAASDAFFPFPDGIEALAKAGIKSVVQPGGSKRDADVIAAANSRGIAMVFTGFRHFRH
jgi:phosphoribosylaminoimidazolecarboxamide formyltransferase/IMP cyclohydrolase